MFRNRTTGEVLSESQLRRVHRNVSLPGVISEDIAEGLGYDPVFQGTRPTPSTPYEVVVSDGVVEVNGKWYTKFKLLTNPNTGLVDEYKSVEVRTARDELLKETDWAVLPDVSTSQEMLDYRQALRDVPSQAGFPHDVVWPEMG